MSKKIALLDKQQIKDRIYTIRGVQVMLDSDLAELYGVEAKRLNEQVKRNIERFPEKFRFQLTQEEFQNSLRSQFATLNEDQNLRFQNGTLNSDENLKSQIATLEKGRGKHRKYLPYVFTEQGVSMLSAVLKSDMAIKVSIQIMDAFVGMRKFIANNAVIFQRLDKIEQKQLITDTKIDREKSKFTVLIFPGYHLKSRLNIFLI